MNGKDVIEGILNLIFPPVCGFCGNLSNAYLCSECYKLLENIKRDTIDIYEDKYYVSHFWLYEYKDKMRDIFLDFKFNDKSYLYNFFVEVFVTDDKARKYIESFDYIVSVPIHKKRLKERGYNQCDLIVNGIVRNCLDVIYVKNLLKKVRGIGPQSKLNKEGRKENIIGAFEINNKLKIEDYKNKTILIFDDIYTTGSTLNECAKVLQALEFKKIGVISIFKD